MPRCPQPLAYPLGLIHLGRCDERTGRRRHHATARNLWMYTYGFLAAQCLGRKDFAYALSMLYIEFANVAAPGDTVAPPAVTSDDALAYYTALAGTSDRDFLRVPIRPLPDILVAPGYSSHLDSAHGNQLFLSGSTSGQTAGVLGKPFSEASNSLVLGVAVVATPVPTDWTQDVLFARGYYAQAKQLPKVPNEQITVDYEITFG